MANYISYLAYVRPLDEPISLHHWALDWRYWLAILVSFLLGRSCFVGFRLRCFGMKVLYEKILPDWQLTIETGWLSIGAANCLSYFMFGWPSKLCCKPLPTI